ncbi:glycosyltransferase family 4 protein [Methylorubrum aminovorans]
MKVMIWNAARGGMRSVVEGYIADGFIDAEDVRLIHSYTDDGFLGRQVVLLAALARFTGALVTGRVELVHIHAAMRGSFWRKSLFARLARLRGIPVLLHLHGSEMKAFYESQSPAVKTAIVSQLERATRVLVLSESWQGFIQQIAPRARVVVMPNYVALPPPATRVSGGPVQLLFLGALGPRKGIFDLLRALARAAAAGVPLHLTVGGDGQLTEARQLAAELGLGDRVTFEGWVDTNRRAVLLNEADAYVLPSYNEGLPMSVLEAMAAGLPVVTTTVGGLPELITSGEHGLLIKPGNVDALAEAIIDLSTDPQRRSSMGTAARERVAAHYSRPVVLSLLKNIYAETVRRVEMPIIQS